ncbi:MAG: phytoene/squalene synthase family protein [Bryobacteraceae bacterium]
MAWSLPQWQRLEQLARRRVCRAVSETEAWDAVVECSRMVLREFSSSFFLVTRFLPPRERAEVEVIYASVRFPDEIVDTFPLDLSTKLAMLDQWERRYREAQELPGVRARVARGAPWILAGFAEVVLRRNIPPEHYASFLGAMRRDVQPAPFANLKSLIEDYVYGSAIVVGYFLTHVYGHGPESSMAEALRCARELGIALQLTNFARDVMEDHRRGRLYLPLDILNREGLTETNCMRPENEEGLRRAVRVLANTAEQGYEYTRKNLNAFGPDCRTAIGACIQVYQRLNQRILTGDAPLGQRVSLSVVEKFRVLPPEKYWRIPLAYAGLL